MANIEVKNLNYLYKNRKTYFLALDNFNYTFRAKKITAVIGPSGSGKTSLLDFIAGVHPEDGEIYLNGIDISSTPPQERQLAYVHQDFVLYPSLTVFDNIALPLKVLKMPPQTITKKVNELAKELGIAHCLTRKPRYLSVGQQQRVALARALIKEPNILLLDEPFANLDQGLHLEMRCLVKEVVAKNEMTTILATHNAQDVLMLADDIIILDQAKIIKSGTKEEVIQSNDPLIQAILEEAERKFDA